MSVLVIQITQIDGFMLSFVYEFETKAGEKNGITIW